MEGSTMEITAWAQTLINTLQDHMDSEREALREYGRLAVASPDSHVRFLMDLILQDEVRHHQLFAEMMAGLRREVEQRGDGGLPDMKPVLDPDALRAQTKALLDLERDDIKELRALRKQLGKVEDTSWWSVLVEVMEADNEKHIKLLEFIRDQT
ncbi:MAG: hypothetical protein ACRDJP_02350 [Actinomycetota bacterium]